MTEHWENTTQDGDVTGLGFVPHGLVSCSLRSIHEHVAKSRVDAPRLWQ